MSLFLDSVSHRRANGIPPAALRQRKPQASGKALKVAIVNNMPDSALVATERQFVRLARGAADGALEISLFHLPGLPRGEDAKAILNERYHPAERMFEQSFDALIVTGNEPRAARLDEEPYWRDLIEIVDWAQDNTRTSLWSCLAAHAAVLYLDGIERRRLPQKKSGVLTCAVANPLGLGLPDSLSVCHSRMNEVQSADLLGHGYDILSEAPGGHVDIFTKKIGSRFLFLQGHPEYDADSLMREYRRDAGRYLNGIRDTYPEVPEGYFDTDTTIAMENYRTLAERSRDMRLFESFPAVSLRSCLSARLAESAHHVFRSWMAAISSSAEVA